MTDLTLEADIAQIIEMCLGILAATVAFYSWLSKSWISFELDLRSIKTSRDDEGLEKRVLVLKYTGLCKRIRLSHIDLLDDGDDIYEHGLKFEDFDKRFLRTLDLMHRDNNNIKFLVKGEQILFLYGINSEIEDANEWARIMSDMFSGKDVQNKLPSAIVVKVRGRSLILPFKRTLAFSPNKFYKYEVERVITGINVI
jgi:hypothetical protein